MSALLLLPVMVAALAVACVTVWGCAVLNERFEDRVSRHPVRRKQSTPEKLGPLPDAADPEFTHNRP